jgi:hypothetical protein
MEGKSAALNIPLSSAFATVASCPPASLGSFTDFRSYFSDPLISTSCIRVFAKVYTP